MMQLLCRPPEWRSALSCGTSTRRSLLDRSLFLGPSLAVSWVRSAWVRHFLGQFDLAIKHASRAMRLSPLDPLLVGMQTAIAFAHFCAGRYDQAVTWSEAALSEQAHFAPAMRILVASSASLDRMDDAAKWLARLREINAVARMSELMHYPFQDPRYSAKFVEALAEGRVRGMTLPGRRKPQPNW